LAFFQNQTFFVTDQIGKFRKEKVAILTGAEQYRSTTVSCLTCMLLFSCK